jgi:multicomponent Na+:H+ antiporter subunit G
MIWTLLCGLLCVSGSFFLMVAAIGIVRMPDLYTRMHAATKAPTLGLGLLLIGATCFFHSLAVLGMVLVVILFIIITTSVASHLLAKSAYQLGEAWENKASEDAYLQHLKIFTKKEKSPQL